MALCIGRRLLLQPRLRLSGSGLYSRGQHRLTQALFDFPETVRLALPDHDARPPKLPQPFRILRVPPPVSLQLGRPVCGVTLRDMPLAAVVTVPKAPMHQHDNAPLREHHVRLSRQVFPVQPEPVAHPVQDATNAHFRPRISGGYAAHDLGPPLLGVHVHRGSPCAHRLRGGQLTLSAIVVAGRPLFQGQTQLIAYWQPACASFRPAARSNRQVLKHQHIAKWAEVYGNPLLGWSRSFQPQHPGSIPLGRYILPVRLTGACQVCR